MAAIGYLFFVGGFEFTGESLSLVRGIVSKFHFNVHRSNWQERMHLKYAETVAL